MRPTHTASGMVIRRTVNEFWPEEIMWPVVKTSTQKGWRSGKTRVYTLKCGHHYSVPASRPDGCGKTAHCTFCTQLWRWMTTTNSGGVSPDHPVKDMHATILDGMNEYARIANRLVRPVTKPHSQKEV
jgi:hypothetical protein